MSHFVYILYSQSTDKYYVGQTEELERRLSWHNNAEFASSSTKAGAPWELYFSIRCVGRKQAILIEQHIKRMKSRKYLQNLVIYPLVSQRLLEKYS